MQIIQCAREHIKYKAFNYLSYYKSVDSGFCDIVIGIKMSFNVCIFNIMYIYLL